MAAIGRQIRAICAIINAQGPLSYRQVSHQMQGVALTNVHKCLQRAATLGIVTRQDGLYSLAPEWQAIIEQAAKPRRIVKPIVKPIVNSVWSFANA